MNYILSGDPNEVAKVLQENRVRINRGVISFTPVDTEVNPQGFVDNKYISAKDSKNVDEVDKKGTDTRIASKRTKKSE